MSSHERNVLIQTIEEGPDRFQEVFSQWIDMPRFNPKDADYPEFKTICDPKRTPEIEEFLEGLSASVRKEIDSDDYEGAINIVTHAFQASQQFTGDHIMTVRRHIWYQAGYIHEHRAMYGDLSEKPRGDRDRTACFLKAATCYMQADLLVAHVSGYAFRVAESLNGAGAVYEGFAANALQKLLGDDVLVVSRKDPTTQVMTQDLRRRSNDTLRKFVPGGGDVVLISKDNIPPTGNN